ncbi:MAG TPA: thioesterase domain-containing protein, partial [Chthonomonadaceae bacterium]|nr:thioesterase domain-containing protein [Chthonomonadaceae bacterium]
LRQVITAGEQLVITEAIADFFKALPDCSLENHYGPTEAHLVTSYTLDPDPATWPTLPPIGKAVTGVTLYILNEEMEPVATGELGELYIGGDCLARGYLNQPALTEERFLPDPFRPGTGERIYKTGDIVRMDAEGVVQFLGRSDDQLKVRGFRIEPGEIELTLTNYPHVSAAAVGLRTIAEDVNALVAYIVCSDPAVTAADLSKHVRSLLPNYMVPARFVMLDALPLTATGKIDRRALSAIDLPSAPVAEEAPADVPLAETIRVIWERVLGHDEFTEDDDFFDVGGDSLLAAWVVTELSQAVSREIELSVLLQDSTIQGLVNALEREALKVAGTPQISEIMTLRAGPSSRALYFVHQLGGELLAYREVARAIRSPLRVLGLRWRPDSATHPHPLSLEEMAAVHVAHLCTIQPHGPYLLAGWSFGGVLAYEIAQQLMAAGHDVDFLGLLDANPVRDPITGVPTPEAPYRPVILKVLADMDRSLAAGEPDSDVSHLFADPAWNGLLGDTVPEGVMASHIRKNLELARDSMSAVMSYRAKPYHGPIDLYYAADTSSAIQQALETELRNLALGPLRIHPIPGDHCGILRAPSAETMARAMDQILDTI